jgi:endo-1,4-beta-xylanase
MRDSVKRRVQWALLALGGAALAAGLPSHTRALQSAAQSAPADSGVTLRDVADSFGFRIGSIMQYRLFRVPQYGEVLGREFNTVISFVFMKQVEPAEGEFDFRVMDHDMEFARAHHMKLFGASEIYRAGVVDPEWLVPHHYGDFGHSKEEFDRYLKEYIEAVERHGGDTYLIWEVVGEPLSNPNQPWQAVFGRDEYIAKAFRYAREANPSALLELNQTFGHAGVDRAMCDEFFNLIQRLKSQGVPIDVAGTEMHLEAQELRPDYLDELRYFLGRARAAGVKSYISEMDVYQGPLGAFPDPMEHQRKIYHDVAATCLADSNCIGLNVYGVSDVRSWIQGKLRDPHPDAKPLLFDEQFRKKPAYFGVLSALQEHAALLKHQPGGEKPKS